jgi:hypothetical protein
MMAVVVVASSLSGLLTAIQPQTTDAAPPASAAIVPDTYNANTGQDVKNNASYLCKASISGPSDLGDKTTPSGDLAVMAAQLEGLTGTDAVTQLFSRVQGASSAAKTTFSAVAKDQGALVIGFNGANNNSDNNEACTNSLILFRDASGTSTTFYGFWNTGKFTNPGNSTARTLIAVQATVNVTNKTVAFSLPSGYSRSGSFTLNVADSSGIIKVGGPYFSAAGGGGSSTGGTNCFERSANTDAALAKCIAAGSPASFVDTAHILYEGDTYTATGWGNVSNKIVYKLTTPADTQRLSSGTPQIVMDTTQKNLDINMDDKGSLSQIQSIGTALKNAVAANGSTVKLELDNIDVGGNQAKGTITATPYGLSEFATYYSQDDAIALVFSAAGTNETPYFGTYERVKGTNNFALAGSNWGGKCSNLTTFVFASDPKTPPTAHTEGGVDTPSMLPADWRLNANDGPCTIGHVPVNVVLNTTAAAPDTSASTDTTGTTPTINCSVSLFNPLSWFLCPLASALEVVVTGLDNEINNFLTVKSGKGSYSASCDATTDQWCAYYRSWSVVRNISLGLIAVFALIAVVSQAFGFEVFDAYTIRKVLPRLLIAAIGITLSWPLMMFFINLTNDLGFGVRQLIYAPFNGYKEALGGGAQFIGTFFVAGGAILLLGFAGLLSFVATGALAAAVAFLVLILRQMVIAFLVILAPIALACYVLPGTQKVWKLWWDSFSRGLLMFPIIAGIIAIGRVFAAVNSHGGSINQIIAFVAYFAPYFMIPFTFRLAGGAIATLGGLVNNSSRGAFDRLKKFRTGQVDKNIHDMKTGNRFQGDSAAANAFNSFTRNAALVPHAGFNPAKMRQRIQAAGSRTGMDEAAEFGEKNSAFNVIKGNDDLLSAGLQFRNDEAGARQFLQGRGYSEEAATQGVAAIRAARRAAPGEVFDIAAAMALPATGTAFRGGAGEMHEVINEVAGDDRILAGRMLASMRGGASGARRFDISGGGFGAELATMEEQYNGGRGGGLSVADANARTVRQALEGQGGNYVAGARRGAVENFAPAMLDNLNGAVASGDHIAVSRELAKLAGRYDAMAQVAPENAEVLANQVMGQTLTSAANVTDAGGNHIFRDVDGNAMSVRQMIESRRTDDQFLNMRKEYGQQGMIGASAAATAAHQAQLQQQAAQQGPNPGAQPPIQPPLF